MQKLITIRKSQNSRLLFGMRATVFMVAAMVCTLLCVVGQPARATPYFRTITEEGTLYSPNVITFDFTDTPAPSEDGVLYVEFFGDFDAGNELINVYDEDGTHLRTLLGTNAYQSPNYANLNLGQSQLSTWASDGTISFTFTPSYGVNNESDNPNEYISATLEYVPEPATIALLGLGGLALLRRRRRKINATGVSSNRRPHAH